MSVAVNFYPAECTKHCSVCDGMDHHWMPDFHGDPNIPPMMACKHCSARRMPIDEDFD